MASRWKHARMPGFLPTFVTKPTKPSPVTEETTKEIFTSTAVPQDFDELYTGFNLSLDFSNDDILLTDNLTDFEINNGTRNDSAFSEDWQDQEFEATWLYILCFSSITFLAVVGNFLVLLAWYFNPNLHIQANNNILSLAFADICLGLFVMPLSIMLAIQKRWIWTDSVCGAWFSMDLSLSVISICNLVNIAIDRYEAVKQPLAYSFESSSLSISKRKSLLAWLTGIILSLPVLSVLENLDYNKCGMKVEAIMWLPVYMAVVCFIIPLTFIIVVYARLYTTIKMKINSRLLSSQVVSGTTETMRQTIQTQGNNHTTDDDNLAATEQGYLRPCKATPRSSLSNTSRQSQCADINLDQRIAACQARERKVAIVMLVLVLAFMVCHLPFWTCYLVLIYYPAEFLPQPEVLVIIQWIAYSNSAINPVVYTVFNTEYRNAIINTIGKLRKIFRQ